MVLGLHQQINMSIHVLDLDPRQTTDKDNYPLNHGSFSEVAIQMNNALKEIGQYAEPDDAEYVGICDGLNVGFHYKNKKSFVIHVWEASSLPLFVYQTAVMTNQRIFGLSHQITDLWHKYGKTEVTTVYGGCDGDFWKPSKPKNTKVFQFCHVNSSNVRSGLDLSLQAFAKAFEGQNDVLLVVKDTNPQNESSKLVEQIEFLKKTFNVNINYISKRTPATYIRDLYSESHVTLNLLRATSFGMPILDSMACQSVCVTGDVPPTNELASGSKTGVLVKAYGLKKLNETSHKLSNEWGLLNCYGNFQYVEEPYIWDFDVDAYAAVLKDVKSKYHERYYISSLFEGRKSIIKNWDWKISAQTLYNNLYGKR